MRYLSYLFFTLFTLLIAACGDDGGGIAPGPGPEPEPSGNPDAMNINDYVKGLVYDPVAILNVTDASGGTSQRTLTGSSEDRGRFVAGYRRGCTTENYNLKRNFEGISILRPTNGVVYPGALVLAGSDMLRGVPLPLSVPPAPVTLSVDLPGIGAAGSFTVDKPSNSTVQVALNGALESWNAGAFQDGYFNAARSEYEVNEAFSSVQSALDLGLNVEWASNSVASQLSVDQSTTKRTALLAYKQIFYTVTADAHLQPADAFDTSATLAQVRAATTDEAPPAYVSSVDYGRIVLYRLETTDTDLSIDLKAVMNYAAGGTNVEADLASKYNRVLKNSTIRVITIGGNAEAAAQVLENLEAGPGALTKLIAENAVYRRDNPGIPVSYKVNLLANNEVLRMGYTTDYSVERCGDVAYNHPRITFRNKLDLANVRVRLTFRHERPGPNWSFETGRKEVSDKTSALLPDVPNGAWEVRMIVERFDPFSGWFEWKTVGLNYIEDGQNELCWEAVEGIPDKLRKCQ